MLHALSHVLVSFPSKFFPFSDKTAFFSLFFLDQVSSFQSESVALAHTLQHIHQQPHQLQRMRQQAPRKKTVLGRGAALRQQHKRRKEGTLPGPCTAAHLALSHSPNGHMRTPLHTIRHTKHRSKEYKVKKTKKKTKTKRSYNSPNCTEEQKVAAPLEPEKSCLQQNQTFNMLPHSNKGTSI